MLVVTLLLYLPYYDVVLRYERHAQFMTLHMVSTDHMQKARVRKFHTVAYSGQTVSAVSGSLLLNRLYVGHFPLAHYRLGHNSEKLLGFGALHFHVPPVKRSDYTLLRRP